MPNSYILTETCLGVVPAVEMALQDVNDWPDILPGYKLHMQMKDSQVFWLLQEKYFFLLCISFYPLA